MNVLVDTTMWSLALRRKKLSATERRLVEELSFLIQEVRAVLVGQVRQEILSGVTTPRDFEFLKERLRAFENLPIISDDYERAADFYNTCRKNGIQGSHIDFLICAVSYRSHTPIFTTDEDFRRYSAYLPVELHQIRKEIN